MSDVVKLLDKCERMAKHSFVREALDLINNPFNEITYDRKTYIHAAYQALKVNYGNWSYEISGNLPNVLIGMKKFSQKAITYNKFSAAVNEIYYLDLLQRSSINQYKYLIFAYGKVPEFKKYVFHFVNLNDGYIMCASPLKAKDVIGLAERIKHHLPEN